jgi:flagellar protein FliS
MNYGNAQNAYRENSILHSKQEDLVPILYEHLLINLKRASRQIGSGDLEGKAASIEKASSILYELLGTLDFEVGGELASRLASLYAYFLREVTEASRNLESERLDPLIDMVGSLHESWVEAVEIVSGQDASLEDDRMEERTT